LSESVNQHVGGRIRLRRHVLGMTQQELAVAVGVRFQQIQKYETSANKITVGRLWSVAQALGVNPEYFFEGLAELCGEVGGSAGGPVRRRRRGPTK
jgi:transcriptional regulator with XRE-family HTH domain